MLITAITLVLVWLILVVAFKVTVVAVHLLLLLAAVVFIAHVVRRRAPRV
jgi:hypothetical protein